jgi:hypothetical protein
LIGLLYTSPITAGSHNVAKQLLKQQITKSQPINFLVQILDLDQFIVTAFKTFIETSLI